LPLRIVALNMWLYEGWPESIRPFWISREPVALPLCNLAASQRRPYVHPWTVTLPWG